MPSRRIGALILLSLASSGAASASERDIFLLSMEELSRIPVTIASGREQAIGQTPAATTVITAQTIHALGATSLEQVLESVPGLHVGVTSLAYNPIYAFRGVYSSFNPEILMLVNGIPITNVFSGNRSNAWGGFPLEDVERIEVIRGPGSALYGADAFAGVINIITKTADDISGTETGIREGSYGSRTGWIEHGGQFNAVSAAFYLEAGSTRGQKGIIEDDLQSFLDKNFFKGSTPVSMAPGPVNMENKSIDARADLAWRDWRLRTAFQRREQGIGAGLAESLDPVSRVPEDREYLDLGYDGKEVAPNWDISSSFAFYNVTEKPAQPGFYLFPPGAFKNSFPDGVIGDPSHAERHVYISTAALYTGMENQILRLGVGFQDDDLYKAGEVKNFRLVSGPIFIPLGGLVDVTGTPAVYITPHRRNLNYALAQDEWSPLPYWTFTAGVRSDHYSDFGTTTNPRLALVWNTTPQLVIKLLHGTAFRAPAFTELYNINNPVNIGNPDLKPETMVSNEVDIGWNPGNNLQTNLSLFKYHMRDIILFVSDPSAGGAVAQNYSNQTGHGFELEATWDATSNLRFTSNYSFQHSIDTRTGSDAGLAPHRHWYTAADWRFKPAWRAGGTINYVAGRDRQPNDIRPAVPDYTIVNLNLIRENIVKGLQGRLSIENMFNRDAREPSMAPGNILYDLPLPGRVYSAELKYNL